MPAHIIAPKLTLAKLREHVMQMERNLNGMRPVVTLACAGYSDEHWQIWDPAEHAAGGDPAVIISRD